MLHRIFEVFSVLGVYRCEQWISQVLPHFFSFKQKHNVIFLVFELLNILVSNEGPEFF